MLKVGRHPVVQQQIRRGPLILLEYFNDDLEQALDENSLSAGDEVLTLGHGGGKRRMVSVALHGENPDSLGEIAGDAGTVDSGSLLATLASQVASQLTP